MKLASIYKNIKYAQKCNVSRLTKWNNMVYDLIKSMKRFINEFSQELFQKTESFNRIRTDVKGD